MYVIQAVLTRRCRQHGELHQAEPEVLELPNDVSKALQRRRFGDVGLLEVEALLQQVDIGGIVFDNQNAKRTHEPLLASHRRPAPASRGFSYAETNAS